MKSQVTNQNNKMLLKDDLGNVSVLSKYDSLKLELLLNKSQYGISWSSIGDALYYFNYNELIVSNYEYKYLMNLFYFNMNTYLYFNYFSK
jgi:hypothetical protein